MKDVAVILPAAGSGKRFGAGQNKIFELLSGQSLFMHTCRFFARRDDVAQILLVASGQDLPRLKKDFGSSLDDLGVQLVQGGQTRTDSVRSALEQIHPKVALVAVHDAVRPCLADAWIDRVFDEARRSGAAMLAWPEHATLKYVDQEGIIRKTVDRSGIWQAQTPQVFRADWLAQAYRQARDGATDDAALIEALGHHVRVVRGDPRNIKITAPADLVLAEALLPTLAREASR